MTNMSELNASLQILAQKAPTNLLWAILSPFTIATNLLISVTILGSKSLYNKSHFVILSHSLAEALFACAHFGTGLVRYLDYYYELGDISSQLMCTLKQTPLAFMRDVVIMLTLALALDRILCLTKPLFYNNKSTLLYTIVLNAFCWTYAVLRNLLAFVGYDRKQVAACFASTAYRPNYSLYAGIESEVVVALTAAIYIVATLIMWRRYKTITFSGEGQRSEWRRRMDLDVFFAMATVGVIYLICWGTTNTVSSILAAMKLSELAIQLAPLTASFILVGSMLHLFVYLWFNRSFRRAFCCVVLRKTNNSVQPF